MSEFDARITHQLDSVEAKLADMGEKIDQLHEVVTTLLQGIAQAQQSGGMAGMMARQFPDMTTVLNQG